MTSFHRQKVAPNIKSKWRKIFGKDSRKSMHFPIDIAGL